MLHYNLERSACSEPGHRVPQGTVKWVFRSGAAVHSSPSIAGGGIYLGSRDQRLYAVDAASGGKLWEYETGSWVESSPAIVNGVVYVGLNDGKPHAVRADTDDHSIYRVHARNGVKMWQFVTHG